MSFKTKISAPSPCILLAAALGMPAGATAFEQGNTAALMELSLAELINIPIVTASRSAETRDQTAAHIMVVTREQIRERRYKNLADLLEDMPGVDFQRGTKTSQFNQFTVQGNLGPNRLLVLMDGVRISHPTGSTYPVAENLGLYQARQVEFLYGPAAALYGADAVSGVVNIITEAGNQSGDSWVSLGAGNFNSKEASFMAGTGDARPVQLSVGGHWQESDRARLDTYYKSHFRKVDAVYEGNTLIPAAQRERYRGDMGSYSLFARLDVQEQFTLGYFRHYFSNLTSTVDPYATTRYSSKARWISTSDTVYARYRFELGDSIQAQLLVDYSQLEIDPQSHYNNIYNGFQPGYSYSYGERAAIEQSLSWQINQAHKLQAGAGYQRQAAIEGGSMPFKYDTGHSPSNQGMVYPNTPLPIQIMHGTRRSYHAYSQLLSEWSPQFSTTLGLRYDRHRMHGEAYNPRLGAVWKPLERHLFKLMYAEAFREPSSEESLAYYGTFDGSQDANGNYIGNGFRVPNESLKPEKARTLSLVWEWRPTRNLNLISNLYHSRITDLVTTRDLPGNNTSFIPGAVLVGPDSKVNAGWQRQTGLDLALQWRYTLNDAWSGDLWGTTGWIHGRISEGDDSTRKIPYVASYRLKLGTTLRYYDRLTVTPKLRWIGSVTNGRKKAPSSTELPPASCKSTQKAPERCATPGYAVMDLHLGWHALASNHLSLWLDVYNLTDKRYYAAAGSGSMTFWDMPQQPRTWMLSTQWRF